MLAFHLAVVALLITAINLCCALIQTQLVFDASAPFKLPKWLRVALFVPPVGTLFSLGILAMAVIGFMFVFCSVPFIALWELLFEPCKCTEHA